MSNRFHNKWHRRNHHTYGSSVNADASHDPIASPEQPFLGDFVLSGGLSAVAPLSAYAAFLYSNNTALCAIAGTRGAYVNANNTGIEVKAIDVGIKVSSVNVGLSSYAESIAGKFLSPKIALSAYGGFAGGIFLSPNIALSANGTNIGGAFTSKNMGISSYGDIIAGGFTSPNFAVSGYGGKYGGYFISDSVCLYTTSSNNDVTPNPNTPYIGPNYKTKNVLNNRTGIFTDNPLSAFHVTGGSLFDGHVTITGNLSVAGDLSRFDTYVYVTSTTEIKVANNSNATPALLVTNYGENNVVEFYDGDVTVPSFIVSGKAARPGYVGVGTNVPNERLTVSGNISAKNNLSAVYIHIAPDLSGYTYPYLSNIRANFLSNVNSYAQVNNQNVSTGNNASSDYIATAENGSDSANYIDLGINNSTFSQTGVFDIVGAGEGYLYTNGGNLGVGTASTKDLLFFTNGTLAANERVRVTSGGNVGIGTLGGSGILAKLTVNGSLSSVGTAYINDTGSSATNIANTSNIGAVSIGNSTGTNTQLGSTIYLNNNAGSNITNIGNGTTTGAVSIGNSTGTNTQLGSTIYLNNNAGSNITNIGTGSTSGDIKLGNTTSATAARVGVGTSPSVRLDVSNNATVKSVANATGTVLHITQADTTNNRLLLDSFGASTNARPAFTGRAASGTAASPSAVLTDAVICEFTGQGYGTTDYSTTSRGRMTIKAAEGWSDTVQGTYLGFETTVAGGTTTTEKVRITDTGTLSATNYIFSNTGIGYPTGYGIGGTGSQSTSRNAAVTLNKPTGTITLVASGGTLGSSAAIYANNLTSFTFTNSYIAATDMLLIHQIGGTGTTYFGQYNYMAVPAAGSATIYVRALTNITTSDTPVLQFAVIKSSIT